MSDFISAAQAAALPLQGATMTGAVQVVLYSAALLGFVLLFKPLLIGIARALVLVVNPKVSKEDRLAKRQMRDALALSRILNKMDAAAPNQSAELRALAARG